MAATDWQQKDDELQAAKWACQIFGWDVRLRRVPPDQAELNTGVHEAGGHALTDVLLQGTFDKVTMEPSDVDGVQAAGHVLGGRLKTVDDRIAFALGGAVAEIVAFGAMRPYGAFFDLNDAIETALMDTDADDGDPYERALDRLAGQARRVLALLTPRKELVMQMARALMDHRTMDFDLFKGIVLEEDGGIT